MSPWRPSYKQRCILCKKNMALITNYRQKPICVPCQMKTINKPITDPELKAFFDIKPELYEKSSFLRNIKEAYLQYGSLSDKQKEVFVKVVGDLEAGREFKPKAVVEEEKQEKIGQEEAKEPEKVKSIKKLKPKNSKKKSKEI